MPILQYFALHGKTERNVQYNRAGRGAQPQARRAELLCDCVFSEIQHVLSFNELRNTYSAHRIWRRREWQPVRPGRADETRVSTIERGTTTSIKLFRRPALHRVSR